jgi:hypothetical protein
VENRINTETVLNAGVSRTYVTGRVHDLAAPYATKGYVDAADAAFSSVAYYTAQDALLIPGAAKGVANGVASLGSDGVIPVVQVPVLGVGILKGPIPVTTTTGGNTFDIPVAIATWTLGLIGLAAQPWVFMAVSCLSVGGRPVVEVRTGTPTQTNYTDQTLVAAGYGRTFYNDYQTVEVFPVDPTLSDGQDGTQDAWAPTTDMVLTAWMFDDAGGQTSTLAGLIVTASAYLARTAL